MNSQTYPAHAFFDGFAKGKSSGSLELSDTGLQFQGGGQSVRMPFNGLLMRMGGARNRLVYFTHPACPSWTLFTADRSVLNHPALRAHPELQHQHRAARRVNAQGHLWLVASLLLLVGLCAGTYFSWSGVVHLAARQIPQAWEESMADTAMDEIRLREQLMPQANVERWLTPVAQPLLDTLSQSPYRFQLFIVNDPAINAFALPGGRIVVNSGLILAANNASELLGVLAHEASHVTEQHGTRNLISTAGTYMLLNLLVGDASGLAGLAVGAAPVLVNQSYSRDFEREADRLGFGLLLQADIDPHGLHDFFMRLQQEEQKRLQEFGDEHTRELVTATYQVLASHPATAERIANLQDLIQQNGADRSYYNLDSEFRALKQAVSEFVTESEQEPEQDEGRD
ncbi:M48 family metallopeptidase [Parathalassolituus penaei]|uniref:M48 family metallopeptidase n=1 Tax=Parathalassolituus penaei TaxID=2997323 RepID=A0A9X3EIL8_9GAMM|nr:M48 family metallopeptidase [Parathalassolituus penaei]MCY0967414.1 M48 family metallopeptidase [Parathalassolituus penaei]